MRRAVLLLLWLMPGGCGPDYLNDENHRGATNDDCIDCHVYGDADAPDAPELSDKHYHRDGSLKDDCKDCHEPEE